MSVESEITRIENNVTNSLSAVADAGVEVASDATSDDLPALISEIGATVVRVSEQSFTDTEKTQARTNIGAASTSDLESYLPLAGGTMNGILYTEASTPFFIGRNGKVGMRAATTDKVNVGQINISNAWYDNGNQYGSQISAYNGAEDAYNELRVSHNGLEYNCQDGNTYKVLHEGNCTTNVGITTAGTGAAYTATVPGITSLSAGAHFIMIPHTASTQIVPTLDVNGLGAKNIRRPISGSTATTVATGSATNWLASGKPILMTYNGSYWIPDMYKPNANDIYGTVPIASGGTGSTTADGARTNLGINTESWTFTLEDGSTVTKAVCII